MQAHSSDWIDSNKILLILHTPRQFTHHFTSMEKLCQQDFANSGVSLVHVPSTSQLPPQSNGKTSDTSIATRCEPAAAGVPESSPTLLFAPASTFSQLGAVCASKRAPSISTKCEPSSAWVSLAPLSRPHRQWQYRRITDGKGEGRRALSELQIAKRERRKQRV